MCPSVPQRLLREYRFGRFRPFRQHRPQSDNLGWPNSVRIGRVGPNIGPVSGPKRAKLPQSGAKFGSTRQGFAKLGQYWPTSAEPLRPEQPLRNAWTSARPGCVASNCSATFRERTQSPTAHAVASWRSLSRSLALPGRAPRKEAGRGGGGEGKGEGPRARDRRGGHVRGRGGTAPVGPRLGQLCRPSSAYRWSTVGAEMGRGPTQRRQIPQTHKQASTAWGWAGLETQFRARSTSLGVCKPTRGELGPPRLARTAACVALGPPCRALPSPSDTASLRAPDDAHRDSTPIVFGRRCRVTPQTGVRVPLGTLQCASETIRRTLDSVRPSLGCV